MSPEDSRLLILAVIIWGTLVGIVTVFVRMTSTRVARRRARREQRLYQSR